MSQLGPAAAWPKNQICKVAAQQSCLQLATPCPTFRVYFFNCLLRFVDLVEQAHQPPNIKARQKFPDSDMKASGIDAAQEDRGSGNLFAPRSAPTPSDTVQSCHVPST